MKQVGLIYSLIALTSVLSWRDVNASFEQMKDDKKESSIVAIHVASLPGDYFEAEITLPALNQIKVNKDGGRFVLQTPINPKAGRFQYQNPLREFEVAFLSIWFNQKATFISKRDLFCDLSAEGAKYRMNITFDKFCPDKPWDPTIFFDKEQ